MCATCGCDGEASISTAGLAAGHDRHGHVPHGHGGGQTVLLEQDVLAKNRELAQRNRHWLVAHAARAVNLMSAPGAGKTTLLERTVRELSGRLPVAVVEGDQETPMDAQRIRATGAPTVQINTGSGCHLDAEMLSRAFTVLDPAHGSLIFVENVGNLVCPALFDLGEHYRIVLISVAEGEEKPLKYPHMFRAADLVLLTKTDLLPYLDFDTDAFITHLRHVNPGAGVLRVAATTGDGLDGWYEWLRQA